MKNGRQDRIAETLTVRHTIRYTICHSGKLLSYNVLHAAVTV